MSSTDAAIHNRDLEANVEPKATSSQDETIKTVTLPPFGGEFQPGPYFYKPALRQFANPAPLGLCAFALTTFILSLINAETRGVKLPNVVVGAAYAYGGLIQLLAGMWEMAVGNTFGATALTSYGGFWISWAIINTGGFGIRAAYGENLADWNNAVGYYLLAWFIFTTILTFCTFKSTLAFCSLFVFLDITFMLLTIGHLNLNDDGSLQTSVIKAGGVFGIITAFIAWWNALAGIADQNNSFFTIPVLHFPWSEKVVSDRRLAQQAAQKQD